MGVPWVLPSPQAMTKPAKGPLQRLPFKTGCFGLPDMPGRAPCSVYEDQLDHLADGPVFFLLAGFASKHWHCMSLFVGSFLLRVSHCATIVQ